jgi:hypothetical protein
MYAGLDGEFPDEWFLDATASVMRRCDVVLVLDGYESSAGTLAEIAEAERCGIPVVYSPNELVDLVMRLNRAQVTGAVPEREHP